VSQITQRGVENARICNAKPELLLGVASHSDRQLAPSVLKAKQRVRQRHCTPYSRVKCLYYSTGLRHQVVDGKRAAVGEDQDDGLVKGKHLHSEGLLEAWEGCVCAVKSLVFLSAIVAQDKDDDVCGGGGGKCSRDAAGVLAVDIDTWDWGRMNTHTCRCTCLKHAHSYTHTRTLTISQPLTFDYSCLALRVHLSHSFPYRHDAVVTAAEALLVRCKARHTSHITHHTSHDTRHTTHDPIS
jgi:hypothetical protein